MARDTHVLRDFEARLRDAGAKFVRVTGRGYRRWILTKGKESVTVDLPTRGYEHGRLRGNTEAEIKRAIRAMGASAPKKEKVREEPPREVETPIEIRAEAPQGVAPVRDEAGDGAALGDRGPDSPEMAGAVSGLHAEADRRAAEVDEGVQEEPATDGRATAMAETTLVCPECRQGFSRPVDLGRHRRQRHGVLGSDPYRVRAREAKAEPEDVGQAAKLAWAPPARTDKPLPVGPPPPGHAGPRPVLVAGTATMERVATLADELARAARDLVTEYKLVREENARLTETLKEFERAFEALRGRR